MSSIDRRRWLVPKAGEQKVIIWQRRNIEA
jgi:hypothetical protein